MKEFPIDVRCLFSGKTWIAGLSMAALLLASAPVLGQGSEKLNEKEQKLVDAAIDRGVDFLRKVQLPNGSFGNGVPTTFGAPVLRGSRFPTAFAAFPALAMLECGVPAGDQAVKNAARFVRQSSATLERTYEISLAIVFLDKLGKAEDRPLIRTLGLRLAAGQRHVGGWGYVCPVLTKGQEEKLLKLLSKKKPEENLRRFPLPKDPNSPSLAASDNSNTQFAILGLWAARKYDLPFDYCLSLVGNRFRSCQQPGGWGYAFRASRGGAAYGSMTAAGLLGLAVGRGSAPKARESLTEEAKRSDEGITWGLKALAHYMKYPGDTGIGGTDPSFGPKGKVNLYLLWSVERVGVFCNLKTIGGKDWYRWGADLLLRTQNANGSWTGRGNGGTAAVIDTSMALLFLKRSDLLPGLRETLQKRLKITDPYFDKAISPKKSPGEKTSPKSKSPGEKNDLKNGIEKKTRPEKTGLSMPELSPWPSPFPRRCAMNFPEVVSEAKGTWQNPKNWLDPEANPRVPAPAALVQFLSFESPVLLATQETDKPKHKGKSV
jgi:hypothetical protein